ncbi:helix-turn-helix domain-containing protein [Micromonospora fulviviridis]|uniref:helix-turn-helix domain-containing protein n=1 Tax=Micromonospora fulviviridis TaxID=47860 RepID=UPI0037B4A58F
MRERLAEPLTVDDLATAAMFSRYHFSRMFRRITGISPGRFLAALRIQEAKHLLITTSLTVAAISTSVGYTSLGTFSSRFHRSVGVSPASYRRRHLEPPPLDQMCRPASGATLTGEIHTFCPRFTGPIFVGLFPDAIAEGSPAGWAFMDRPGRYQLSGVSAGSWYLIAHSVGGWHTSPQHANRTDQLTAIARYGPVRVTAGDRVEAGDMTIRPSHDLDPPALLSLLDLPPEAVGRVRLTAPDRSQPLDSAAYTRIGRPPRILSDSIGSGTTW